MQVKRFVGTGLAVVALVVGTAGCGGGDDDDDIDAFGGAPVVVMKSDPKPHFEPDEFRATVGSEVVLRLRNEGDEVHNFTVSFAGVDQDVPPGQTAEVRFRVPEPIKGVDYFTFYDEKFQGEGMQGRININR